MVVAAQPLAAEAGARMLRAAQLAEFEGSRAHFLTRAGESRANPHDASHVTAAPIRVPPKAPRATERRRGWQSHRVLTALRPRNVSIIYIGCLSVCGEFPLSDKRLKRSA